VVQEWELVDNGAGRVAGVGPLRQFQPGGTVEGMVADDETGPFASFPTRREPAPG